MMKKAGRVLAMVWLMVNCTGCFMLLAGAAGGAGTAVWLSGKVSQEVNVSYERSIEAAKKALSLLRMPVTKETIELDVAQLMSKYSDGRTVWIDVRKVTQASSKIEVRVGGVKSDTQAADKIFQEIRRYL